MNQNSVETSLCNPLPQEILQCQNHSYQQQQQRMMMYGAPTPVASPEGSHRQIALEQFNRHQYQQQQNEKIRRASLQHKYQLEGDRSQNENRDAIHSQRYPSVNWNNTKSPSSIHSFTSDNSTHPSGNSSEQDSPYISSQNQMLNHTKNKHELSLAESSPAQQGMGSIPPNTIPILTQNYHRSCYQPQEQYSAGPAYSPAFYQQPQRPRLTTTLWEDEGTVCFQVDAKGICVARRKDNNMINGTKLLNVVGMSRGKRDGILKNEKGRVVVKVGAMHLKGVWITIQRAKVLSAQFHILDLLYPLFVDEPNDFLFSPGHHSISSLSSPSILLQGGPSITEQRQLSHLQTSGITGYTLDPIRQPLMPPCPIAAFAANRDLRTEAKSNGRHTSEIDMYLAQQIPAVRTDFRGLGNPAGFQYPNGGYSWNGASHFSNHSFNGYGPPYNPSTMPRYMIAGGDMFSPNGSTYTGDSNVTENSTLQPEQQMHCRQLQNQHQLQQNRRILQAMSSEPNEIPAENTSSPSKTGSISPEQAPSDATVNSLTLQTPSTGIYHPNDVYQILPNSGIGSGSGGSSPQASEIRKRSHDSGPGASTHISCSEENRFPSPLSVSPPATPILRPSLLDSCSPPSAKRLKEELSPQAAPHANDMSAQQQFLPIAKLNAEEKQSGQNSMTSRNNNGNGQRVSWTNGHKINVPSSHGQEDKESVYMEQSQCIPPRSESYTFPETKNNRIDIQQLPYEFHGDGTLGNSTSALQQQSQISQQIPSPDQSRQQQEHSPGQLESKAGQQVPSNDTAADGQFSILQSYSSRLLDSQSAVGALLGIADRMDAQSGCAKDQCKPRPSPTTEIQW